MFAIKNLFYSFNIKELPLLGESWNLCKQLSNLPPEIEGLNFSDVSHNPTLQKYKDSLDLIPDKEFVLQDEAENFREKEDSKPTLKDSNLGCIVRDNYVRFLRSSPVLESFIQTIAQVFETECKFTGNFLYPPGAFREWHTNCFNIPGWRMYMVDVLAENSSYFRLLNPVNNEIVTIWDQPGNVSFFRIDPQQHLFHCVASKSTYRWSKGFVIPDNWKEKLGITEQVQ